MSYKTQCGNAAFFWLRFHTIIKKYSDYQRVIFQPMAASRRVTLETLTVVLWKPWRRLRRSCGNRRDDCSGKRAIPRGGNPGSYSICHV